jgi:hypothetical protein
MNDRIDKLIEQCTRQNFSDCVGGFETFDKEKFAELIVKECLEQIDKIRDGCEADNEDQQALGADWAGLAVSRHFGVEE